MRRGTTELRVFRAAGLSDISKKREKVTRYAVSKQFLVADLFCGAGGLSTDAEKAIRALGAEMVLVAVNHWPLAIETHHANHPNARHYIEDLTVADPERIVPKGRLDLLMASPQCTFFSRARGGKPVNDQQRMDPWAVQKWLTKLDVACLLVENVPEFVSWGPVLSSGKPDPAKKGLYFQAWVQALWGLGYTVDWRFLKAADYGDATTRTRFFLQARKDGSPIKWPEASHTPTGSKDMFDQRPKWRAARDVIDWQNPGASLLDRKKPLSIKTRLRITRGLQRFGGVLAPLYVRLLDLPPADEAKFCKGANGAAIPFVTAHRQNNVPKSVDEPLQTVTTIPGIYVYQQTAEPFIMANRNNCVPKGTGEPVPAITTTPGGGGIGLVNPVAEPFVLGQQSGSVPRSTEEPIPTIATDGFIRLIDPILTPYYGTSNGGQGVDKPVPTITGCPHFGLVQPLAVPYGPRAEARGVDEPLPTILTKDRLGVATPTAQPFVLGRHGYEHVRDTENPLPTVTGSGGGYLVEPFIVPHFGEWDGQAPRVHAIDAPVPAVTSRGAGSLVTPTLGNLALAEPPALLKSVDPRRVVVICGVYHLLDIRFRMLLNVELARAMSFEDKETKYEFFGSKREVTKQIGNAVPVRTAAALVSAILG